MIRDFKRFTSQNVELTQLQSKLQEFFAPFVSNPLLDGTLLTGVVLAVGENKVEHKLQRAPLGWIVVGKNATCDIWEPSKDLNKAFITLQSSAAVTVNLWVF